MNTEQFAIIVEHLETMVKSLEEISLYQAQVLVNQRRLIGDVISPLTILQKEAEELKDMADAELRKVQDRQHALAQQENDLLTSLADKNEEIEATKLGPQ